MEEIHTHSATVVDESRQVPTLSGVDDCVVVHSEQVAAPDALLRVPLLSIVGDHLHTPHTGHSLTGVRTGSGREGPGTHLSDVLTHILDDHLISSDGLHGEQTPLVDPAAAESKPLLTEL